jgi:NADPH:quinone reductase-like Zn-dependent oxidoreductase
MKAIVRHEYGGPEVLRLEEIETPTPRDDEVLVKVHAASANLGDWEILRADPFYITVMAKIFGPKPRHAPVPTNDTATPRRHRGLLPKYKVLGSDVAGRVEAVGKDVTQHKPGDEVFGMCFFGAFAEYVCIPNRAPLVPKPGDVHRSARSLRERARSGGTKGLDQWRGRRGRHACGADRQITWR